MRRLITFPCAGETLAGSLDEAGASTGLLIVSGGNELRIGAHRGMAMLAARTAEAGYPVFRYDRRGIGDSTGENGGFETASDDIAAAAAAFRAEAGVQRIVAYGNCDAATALVFHHVAAGIDALVLANPWAIEPTDDLPPAAAIRSHYAQKLRDPREWLRMARGGVNISKLFKGLAKVSDKRSEDPASLAARLSAALDAATVPVTILLAKGDNTAIAFADAVDASRHDVRTLTSDSHSFASPADKDWLFDQVLAALD